MLLSHTNISSNNIIRHEKQKLSFPVHRYHPNKLPPSYSEYSHENTLFCQLVVLVMVSFSHKSRISTATLNSARFIPDIVSLRKTPTKYCYHITPVLRSIHWPKIPERVEHRVISLNTRQSSQPFNLCQLFSVQPRRSTQSELFFANTTLSFH